MMNNIDAVLATLDQAQKDQLLVAFVTTEYNKKVNEINKNYKDEAKRAFAHSNIVNSLHDRLVKKLNEVQGKQEISEQVEMLEQLL